MKRRQDRYPPRPTRVRAGLLCEAAKRGIHSPHDTLCTNAPAQVAEGMKTDIVLPAQSRHGSYVQQ